MSCNKEFQANIPVNISPPLPEEDAFLYSINYPSWIEMFITKSTNKKVRQIKFISIKRLYYAQTTQISS